MYGFAWYSAVRADNKSTINANCAYTTKYAILNIGPASPWHRCVCQPGYNKLAENPALQVESNYARVRLLYPALSDSFYILSAQDEHPVAASSLSSTIERAGTLLQNGALDQIEGYRVRFETIEGLFERAFSGIFKSDFNRASATETAKKLFGSSRVPFAAIDGTEYARPLFDLVVFFGGSYAARGFIDYRENEPPAVEYGDHFLKSGRAVSSCVPVYVNEVPEIDQSFVQPGETSEISLTRPLTDEAIANNSTVPNWIMTFSEFYLAYKLATENSGPRILLMDRSLANMLASLIYDTSRKKTWHSNGALCGLEIDGIPIDINDLAYARHRVDNPALDLPSPRGDYLRYRCLLEIEKNGPLTATALCEKFRFSGDRREKRVERLLKRSVEEGFLDETAGAYALRDRYHKTWPRIRNLVETLGHRMFEEKPEHNPLRVMKKRELALAHNSGPGISHFVRIEPSSRRVLEEENLASRPYEGYCCSRPEESCSACSRCQ